MEGLSPDDPTVVGTYRLVARLGKGGVGPVYLARSEGGRHAVLRLVDAELARQEGFRRAFREEVAVARRAGGKWLVPVVDSDTEAAVPWVATEYVPGTTLAEMLELGVLPESAVRTLAAGLAHGLQDIHAAGGVHGDLKPSSVLLTAVGPRITDLGMARAFRGVRDGAFTRTGQVWGSPAFLSPEQLGGEPVTPASDVFALGSLLVYAATGSGPFGVSDTSLAYRIVHAEPDLEGLPDGLADLVADCLRKDPAERPLPGAVLERSGPRGTVADGSSGTAWLPGHFVGGLGRGTLSSLGTGVLTGDSATVQGLPPLTVSGRLSPVPLPTGPLPTPVRAPDDRGSTRYDTLYGQGPRHEGGVRHGVGLPGPPGRAVVGRRSVFALTVVWLAVLVGLGLGAGHGFWWRAALLGAVWAGLVAAGVTGALRRPGTAVVSPGRMSGERRRKAGAVLDGLTDAAVFLRARTAVPPSPPAREAYLADAYDRLGPPPPAPPGGGADGIAGGAR